MGGPQWHAATVPVFAETYVGVFMILLRIKPVMRSSRLCTV